MTEKADETKEVLKPRQAPSAPEAQSEGVIGDNGAQARWAKAQLANSSDQNESATNSFYKPGETSPATQRFQLFDGSQEGVFLAQATDQRLSGTKGTKKSLPKGEDIAKHAQDLGENHPERWRNEGHLHKCNLYLDSVMRASGVDLPWHKDEIPSVHNMRLQLQEHPNDWEQVWPNGKTPYSAIKQQAGDIALWDKKIPGIPHLDHCGILDGTGGISYAGSDVYNGYAKSVLKYMTDSPAFGYPTAIFRSRHLDQ